MRLSHTGRATAVVAAGCLAVLGPDSAESLRAMGAPGFDRVFLASATLLLVALSGWTLLCIGLLVAADSASATGRLARAVTPRFLRHALFVGAASALVIGPAAAISDGGHMAPESNQTLLSQSLDGLAMPDRPVGGAAPVTGIPAPPSHAGVVVRAGDSLWSIAADALGAGSSDSDIAAETRAWHDANRGRIGADPNLIFPGQRLTAPAREEL